VRLPVVRPVTDCEGLWWVWVVGVVVVVRVDVRVRGREDDGMWPPGQPTAVTADGRDCRRVCGEM
jgi:hypothetical protein